MAHPGSQWRVFSQQQKIVFFSSLFLGSAYYKEMAWYHFPWVSFWGFQKHHSTAMVKDEVLNGLGRGGGFVRFECMRSPATVFKINLDPTILFTSWKYTTSHIDLYRYIHIYHIYIYTYNVRNTMNIRNIIYFFSSVLYIIFWPFGCLTMSEKIRWGSQHV